MIILIKSEDIIYLFVYNISVESIISEKQLNQ